MSCIIFSYYIVSTQVGESFLILLSSIIKFLFFFIVQLGHLLMICTSIVFLFGNILLFVRKILYHQSLLNFYFRNSFIYLFECIICVYYLLKKRLNKIWLLDLFQREKASIVVQSFCCFSVFRTETLFLSYFFSSIKTAKKEKEFVASIRGVTAEKEIILSRKDRQK